MLKTFKENGEYRLGALTAASVMINGFYAVCNLLPGLLQQSFWFLTAGAYFFVLTVLRVYCLVRLRQKRANKAILSFTGSLLWVLGVTLMGSVILCYRQDLSTPVNMVIMLGIASFTTAKVAFAAVNAVRARRTGNPLWIALRSISCADSAAAVLSMQRSMLVSFGNMAAETARLMNLLTGLGVCVLVFVLAVLTFSKKGL